MPTQQSLGKNKELLNLAVWSAMNHNSNAGLDNGIFGILAVILSYLDWHVGRAYFNGKPSNPISIGAHQ